jgi:hypothetical protein
MHSRHTEEYLQYFLHRRIPVFCTRRAINSCRVKTHHKMSKTKTQMNRFMYGVHLLHYLYLILTVRLVGNSDSRDDDGLGDRPNHKLFDIRSINGRFNSSDGACDDGGGES